MKKKWKNRKLCQSEDTQKWSKEEEKKEGENEEDNEK